MPSCPSPLHYAAMNGHYDACVLLIEHGANVNADCGRVGTPLRGAVMRNKIDICKLLLCHNVDMYEYNMYRHHLRPFDEAVKLGYIDICILFLDNDYYINKSADTLYLAITNGHIELSEILIRRGIDVNECMDDINRFIDRDDAIQNTHGLLKAIVPVFNSLYKLYMGTRLNHIDVCKQLIEDADGV